MQMLEWYLIIIISLQDTLSASITRSQTYFRGASEDWTWQNSSFYGPEDNHKPIEGNDNSFFGKPLPLRIESKS